MPGCVSWFLCCRVDADRFQEFLQLVDYFENAPRPPGCLDRAVWSHRGKIREFLLTERWAALAGLMAHQRSGAHRALLGGVRALAALELQGILCDGSPGADERTAEPRLGVDDVLDTSAVGSSAMRRHAGCTDHRQGSEIMSHATLTVLVIDDDADIRDAIAAALEAEGHVAIQARYGEEGLASARERHPDVILLDLMMPVMDGWTFRRIQVAEPDLAPIPTVIISAAADNEDGRLGKVLFLHKPFSIDALLIAVREACAQRRSISEKGRSNGAI